MVENPSTWFMDAIQHCLWGPFCLLVQYVGKLISQSVNDGAFLSSFIDRGIFHSNLETSKKDLVLWPYLYALLPYTMSIV